MTLVGLTSLLVGGIGVANGVRAWLDARARTIATLRCLGASSAPGAGGLPDPGPGARRSAASSSGLLAGALAPIALAAWLKDVLPVPPVARPLSWPAAARRLLRPADGAGLLALAARPGGAHPRRRAVPRRADPRARPARRAALLAANAAVAAGADRADHRDRGRSPLRAVVLRRRARHAGPVPPRRQRCVMLAARAGSLRAEPVRAARPCQPAPAGRVDAADAGLGRARPVHAGRRRADRGQRAARNHRTAPGQRAELLLRRHPGQPVAALRVPGARAAGRRGDAAGAQPARPHRRGERRAGRPGACHAGHPVGAARRPRPDLCRHAAAGHPHRRRTLVAARLRRPAAGVVRRRAGPRLGRRHRRRHPGQRARPRHRPAGRQPARHRLAEPVAELHHGGQPRPAAARAAHAYRHRPGGRTRTRAACCAR